MQPVISVVIGTYNQREVLQKVLDSLLDQTLSPDLYEIIVVDSSSSDGTEGKMYEYASQYPFLRYIRQENQGKAAARNRGIQEAKGEIILITDADMIANPELVEEHLLFHNRHKNTMAEGLTYNLKSYDNFKEPSNLSPYIKERIKPEQKIRWSYFLTGNISLPKQLLIEAGMFDASFKGYGWEDLELGYRLKKKTPLYYLPSAINYHYHIVPEGDMAERKYQTGQSAVLFYKKHPNFEIKMFLGMNPLAVAIYKIINCSAWIQNMLKEYSKSDVCVRYVWEEYLYRKGFFEALQKVC
ncbi:MAG: glycosyltransferase [Candidatus Saganbacteria bacterium]|nr:glycosyltransferase [Candidatus Saganbacteria bacterium]